MLKVNRHANSRKRTSTMPLPAECWTHILAHLPGRVQLDTLRLASKSFRKFFTQQRFLLDLWATMFLDHNAEVCFRADGGAVLTALQLAQQMVHGGQAYIFLHATTQGPARPAFPAVFYPDDIWDAFKEVSACVIRQLPTVTLVKIRTFFAKLVVLGLPQRPRGAPLRRQVFLSGIPAHRSRPSRLRN